MLSIVITAGIIFVLVTESAVFFGHVSPAAFLFGTTWSPMLEPRQCGVLPLVCGTFLVAFGSLIVALPIGLGTGLCLSEYAGSVGRNIAKPILEILAGVPSVVYGYFALTFITPYVLMPLAPSTTIYNAASAAIVVGIMVVPTIASLCDDAFRAVPRTLREAGYALSATRFEVSSRIVVPAAMSGVIAAVLLAFARAIGETMAVALAAGTKPNLSLNPFETAQTMTGYIAQLSMGDTPRGDIAYQTIFAVGMLLFAITFTINVVARRIFGRFREAYE